MLQKFAGAVFTTAALLGLCAVHAAIAQEPGRVDSRWCDPHLGRVLERHNTGFALALSGGGYRAMLFHAGALAKLNDAGLLPKLRVVSSVSGGSITSAVLAKSWPQLRWQNGVSTNFAELVIKPIMDYAEASFGYGQVFIGLLPFTSVSQRLVRHYESIFLGIRLADLDYGDTGPVFIFNATSLQTGETIQFRPTALGGPYIGWTTPGEITLSQAVAASSSFPPVFGPLDISLEKPRDWYRCEYAKLGWMRDARSNLLVHSILELQREQPSAYRRSLRLIDGGVRDNLGLDAIEEINNARQQKCRPALDVLVSDGGSGISPEERPNAIWPFQGLRVIDLMTGEPSVVRLHQLISESRNSGSKRLTGA